MIALNCTIPTIRLTGNLQAFKQLQQAKPHVKKSLLHVLQKCTISQQLIDAIYKAHWSSLEPVAFSMSVASTLQPFEITLETLQAPRTPWNPL